MKFSESYLNGLALHAIAKADELLLDKVLRDSMSIAAVCLYGSAAQVHLSEKDAFNDLDLQLFLKKKPGYKSSDVRRLNHHGAPWSFGKYEGKKVEAFFGLLMVDLKDDLSSAVLGYIRKHRSPRWEGHRNKPFIGLWPTRFDWIAPLKVQ